MNIAFDMNYAGSASSHRGIGRYADNLIRALMARGGGHRFFFFYPRYELGAEHVAADIKRFLEENAVDLYVLLSPFEMRFPEAMSREVVGRAKVSVLLHDFIPILFEPIYLGGAEDKARYMQSIELVKNADLIWANSETTRQDALKAAGIDPGRVHVVYAGLDEQFRPLEKSEITETLDRYGIRRPYVLTNGNSEYRKNLVRLFASFAMASKELDDSRQLVVVSHLGEEEREFLFRKAREAGIEDRLVLTGYVQDEELVHLYNGAELFVFPSLYEGFGFPPFEAMSCGTPVLAGNTSSIAELCGGAARLVDPENTEELAGGIVSMLREGAGAAAQKAGFLIASAYRWDRTAAAMMSTIGQLVYTAELQPNRFTRRCGPKRKGAGFSFNMAELPGGTSISSAVLRLPGASNRTVRVRRIKRAWSSKKELRKTTFIAKYAMFIRKAEQAGRRKKTAPVTHSWECTSLARRWAEGQLNNYGMYATGLARSKKPLLQIHYVHLM